MPSNQLSAEQSELEAVLSSGVFNRAPNLASFLKYICEKHFQGEADLIKEYSIAVEALHRSPDFDQKKDSIVRVEALQLRKRLSFYYKSGAGIDHQIQIEIPNGQYAPRFIQRQNSEPLAAVAVKTVEVPELLEASQKEIEEPTPALRSAPRTTAYIMAAALTAALVLVIFIALRSRSFTRPNLVHASVAKEIENWSGSYAEPVPNEFRLLAGYHGHPFTDRQGRIWQPDAYFKGGISNVNPIDWQTEGLPDPHFIRSRREGAFNYAIPARDGSYEVHLHFIGARPEEASERTDMPLFRILINDKPVLDSFDPVSEAGSSDRMHSRVFGDVSPGQDGRIHLSFVPGSEKAYVSAIEVLSSDPGITRPVRIVASRSSVIDSAGSVWWADQDAVGGVLVGRKDSIQDPNLKMFFTGERFGNFAYHIPVPPGKYRARLFFAETFFGSKQLYATSADGARLFNVFANGVALLRNFDVSKEAGGPNKAVVKVFENLEPSAQGNIVLEFVPLKNYAEINAIEIVRTH